MPAFRSAALLAAALASASPALAQDPPQRAPQADVVVTGTPARDREEEIRDFVRALTPAPMTGQLGRFETRICPVAMGLTGPMRTAVENRMRRVAAAVGLPVGGDGCRPSVLLMITRDKRALIEALAARYPHYFGDAPESNPRRLARAPGPAAAWHATAMIDADGRAVSMEGEVNVNQTNRPGTRIAQATRPTFIAAAVVIEQGALPGLTVNQLADYAMMRALARTDPRQLTAASPRTILSVLEAAPDAEVPTTLTRWDLGFLRGLYASTANLRATQQRGEIQRSVAAELDGREGARN